MKMHFCTEEPCPVKDKETAELLESGFEVNYKEPMMFDTIRRLAKIFSEKEKQGEKPLIDQSHNCTCRDFHWQEKTKCQLHKQG
jgi:hypothetical protein